MSWNYRVVKKTYESGITLYGIHEAYYPEGSDKPDCITEEPVTVEADDEVGIFLVLHQMLKATEKPVLDYKDFENKAPES